jgi:Tfp pilus assembly protein PilZ
MYQATERRSIKRNGVNWPVTMLSHQGEVEGEIVNVSSKGAFISCSDIPPLEGSFRMVVKAPNFKSMFLGGKVIWSTVLKPQEGDPRLGIGVQFTSMSAGDRQSIQRAIARHHHEMSRRKTA